MTDTNRTNQTAQDTRKQNSALQLILIAGLLIAAFFGAYKFASARTGQGAAPIAGAGQTTSQGPGAATAASGGAGCACCSGSGTPTANGVTGDPVVGVAQITSGVQAIAVKVGTTYSPNIIKLKAGVPAEITFGQGGGCTAQVVSQDLGFSEDLSAGPKVVKLPALEKGTHSFSCGMGMVFGQIVVE
jgi:hypothetical protein